MTNLAAIILRPCFFSLGLVLYDLSFYYDFLELTCSVCFSKKAIDFLTSIDHQKYDLQREHCSKSLCLNKNTYFPCNDKKFSCPHLFCGLFSFFDNFF